MPGCVHTILLLSRDEDLLAIARSTVRRTEDYRLISCRDMSKARQILGDLDVSLCFCDTEISEKAADFVTSIRVSHPHVARIVVSSPGQAESGVGIAHACAAYFLMVRPILSGQLALVIKRALEMSELSRRHRLLSRELKISVDDDMFSPRQEIAANSGVSRFEKLVYASPVMAGMVTEARLAAATELPVLIHGETGTGKELLARAIHFNSSRLDQPIHVQNCGGIPDDILHSELYGHVRGAYTGAISDRLGLFRAADGGTVFLDEVSEISQNFQVSLLRFLQEGEVKPLGSDKIYYCNVRIVAASNQSLEKMVEQGRFRHDLYFRLKGFQLEIPPLRSRREDIPVLTDFFIEKYAGVVGRRVLGVTQDTLKKLQAYDYPGNVRELETEIRRMVAVAENGGYISARHLSSAIASASSGESAQLPDGGTLKEMVETLERHAVSRALDRSCWNRSRAASELGLSRVGLANKIKRYGLSHVEGFQAKQR